MPVSGLDAIQHLAVLMLENRSLDHMLGYLYADSQNHSPAGDTFEGLIGHESSPGRDGRPVTVSPMTTSTTNLCFMPGADPGEGYAATNDQLYGSPDPPTAETLAPMSGFVTNYATAIEQNRARGWYVEPGTTENMIMACHTPQTLPVLSTMATGFAV